MSQFSPSQQLYNLSLTFYGFHLRNTINHGETTVPEATQLWEQLTNLGQTLNIFELKNLKSRLLCYQNNEYKPELEENKSGEYFPLLINQKNSLKLIIPSLNNITVGGFISPFRLHDCYGMDLTLTSSNPLNPNQLQDLNLSCHLQPTLGQSLLIYAEVDTSLENYSNLANTCVNQLFPHNNNWEFIQEGKLLDCPIFAYDNGEFEPLKHDNVLIWLNPNSNGLGQIDPAQIDKANEYLLYLLWSRQKILYAYHQSRICAANTKKRYAKIEQQISNFSQSVQSNNRLEKFKELLTQLPQQSLEYSQLLRELSDHQHTIKANKLNYQNFLTKLEKLPDSNSNFLQPFLKRINDKFEIQLATDISFLSPANTLFEELLNNIRGFVAIDQLESDRQFEAAIRQQQEESEKQQQKLEWFITLFGTGLAVSSISSAIAADLGLKLVQSLSIPSPSWCINNELAKSSCSALVNFIFHIGVGVIFAFFAGIILWLYQKKWYWGIVIILMVVIGLLIVTWNL